MPPNTSHTGPETNPENTTLGGATERTMQKKKKMSAVKYSATTTVANNPIVKMTTAAARSVSGVHPSGAGRKNTITAIATAIDAIHLDKFILIN